MTSCQFGFIMTGPIMTSVSHTIAACTCVKKRRKDSPFLHDVIYVTTLLPFIESLSCRTMKAQHEAS